MTHDLDALVSVTPVTPVAFHIMLALATGERHGYAIMDATALSAGTIYRAIKRLVAAGLVAPDVRPPSPNDDERRRYYRLTPQGRAVAQAETRRLARLVGDARAALLITGDGAGEGGDDHHAPLAAPAPAVYRTTEAAHHAPIARLGEG